MAVQKIDLLVKNYEPFSFAYDAAFRVQKAFLEQGKEANIINVFSGDFSNYLLKVLSDPPDLTCSFSDFSLKQSNQMLCDQLGVPHFFWTAHPYFYLNYLKSKFGYLGCSDFSHAESIKNSGLKKIYFLPDAIDTDHFIPYDVERPFDIVIFDNLVDCDSLMFHWEKSLEPNHFEIIKICLKAYEEQEILPIYTLLSELKNQDKEIEKQKYGWTLYELEEYLKAKRLLSLLESITDYKIHLFGRHQGQNWLKRLKNAKNIFLHATVAYAEKRNILRQAKVLVRDQCFQPAGSDELTLNAIASGAIVVTNGSDYLKQCFQNREEIFYYPSQNWIYLNEIIKEILGNARNHYLLIEKAQLKARQHGWLSWSEKLLSFYA